MTRAGAIILIKALLATMIPLSVALGVSLLFCPMAGRDIDFEQAERIYSKRCAICHSSHFTAGRPTAGPDLIAIGKTAATRRTGMSAAKYLLESIIDPSAFRTPGTSGEMPPNIVSDLDDGALRGLVAMLASFGARPDFDEIANMQITRKPVTEWASISALAQIKRGKEVFLAQCVQCHPARREPASHLLAPDLGLIANYSAEFLERAISDPDRDIAPGYERYLVETDDGRILSGRLFRQQHRAKLVSRDLNGQLAVVMLSTDRKIPGVDFGVRLTLSTNSLMPKIDLSKEDTTCLLAFMRSMKL